MAKLIIKKEDKIVKKISVHDEILAFTVGSDPGNDIVINDASVSHFHAQFERQDRNYYVRDLQSEWGTFMNGRKISTRTPVKDKDEVGIGNHNIVFLNARELEGGPESTDRIRAELQELAETGEDHPSFPLMNLNSWVQEDGASEREAGRLVSGNGNGYGKGNGNGNGGHSYDPVETRHDERTPTNGNGQDMDSHTELPDEVGESPSYADGDFPIDTESHLDSSHFASDLINDSNGSDGVIQNKEYYLIGIYGYYYGRKFQVKRPETRIGRNAKINDIVVKRNSKGETDQSVSRRQATISFENGRYLLSDKRSKSRTLVNGNQLEVDDRIEIQAGDEIEIISDRTNHIFRMVEKNNWDFSFPKKAGAWHIRCRTKLLNTYALLFLALSSLFVGNLLFTYIKASEKPDPLTVTASDWFPKASKTDLTDMPQQNYPVIADINRDDIVDLVYIDQSQVLKCVDGDVKEVLWQADDFQADASVPITIADLNNDGRKDIVVVSKDMRVRAIDGLWGIEIWQSPILAGPLTGAPVVADFNRDGFDDVAIVSKSSAIYLGYCNYRSARWITLSTDESLRSISASIKGADNETAFLYVGTESGKVLIVDGVGPRVVQRLDINEELSKADGDYFQDQIQYPVAVTDLNGDGVDDIIVYTAQNNLIAFDGQSFERLWFSSDSEAFEEQATSQQMVLGDLDGDELHDVVTLSPKGKLRALKGMSDRQGRALELWKKSTPSEAYSFASLSLADFNNNGTQDVLITTNTGNIHVREGSTGDIIWQGSSEIPRLLGAPVIGDLDHDNQLDVLQLAGDGTLYKFQTNRFITKDAIVWGQPHGNSRRSNYSDFDENYGSISYAYVGPLFVLSLGIVGWHLISEIRRKKLSQLGRHQF